VTSSAAIRPGHDEVVALFLAGAGVIGEAVADRRVGEAWDLPSVLEEQTVGSLAGHLARGGVWAVSEYLQGDGPGTPADFDSAARYFAAFADTAGPETHRAIRERGAALSAAGQRAVVETLRDRLAALTEELHTLPADHLMAVIGGKVIRLGDYLVTRIVEQAVHLDDLARSIGAERWELPEGHVELALSVGVDIARLRRGAPAVLRAVYRRGFADGALPAL
jgi:hypothetical protein